MTLWEFAVCMDGYRRAHAVDDDKPPPMSDEQLSQLGIEGF